MQSNMNKEVKSTSLSALFFLDTFRIKKQNISDNLKIPVEIKIVLYMFFFFSMLNLTFNKRPSPCARGTDKHLHWVLCAHIFTNNMLFSIINSIYTVLFVIWYCPTSPETKSPWWSSSRFQRLHSLQVVKVDKLALKAEEKIVPQPHRRASLFRFPSAVAGFLSPNVYRTSSRC